MPRAMDQRKRAVRACTIALNRLPKRDRIHLQVLPSFWRPQTRADCEKCPICQEWRDAQERRVSGLDGNEIRKTAGSAVAIKKPDRAPILAMSMRLRDNVCDCCEQSEEWTYDKLRVSCRT